jgi:hypothetical protein
MSRLSLLSLLLIAGGCAHAGGRTVSTRVDEGLVAALPPEGRLWTYDAENEVIIALDRFDEARDSVLETEKKIERAKATLKVADKRGKGQDVAEARVTWRKKQRDQAEAEVDVADQAIYCARASLELTKAKLAVRFDLPIKDTNFVQTYEKQYDDCAADLDKLHLAAEKAKVAAGKARDEWRKVRSQYVAKTGDQDHGLWID